MAMHDAKANRLREEYQKLLTLKRRSDFIGVEPVDVQPGYPPERYVITYTCRGIKAVDRFLEPIPSDEHRVEIYLIDFPVREPILKWQTDIWHPNIEHDGLRRVCTDNGKSWYSSKSLDLLVMGMGLMVQYRRYHAKWLPPYPIDKKAANWVLNYAEPRNIVGPDKPFDDRPLLRKQPVVDSELAPGATEDDGEIVFGPPEDDRKIIFGEPFSDRSDPDAPLPPSPTRETWPPD